MLAAAVVALSVVIPSLGSYGSLGRVLDGLAAQRGVRGGLEVVLAVDAADPAPERAEALLQGRPYAARMVRGDRPGASANRNIGIAAARADLILLCDADTVPQPGLVAVHQRAHERHPEEEVGVLGLVRWAPELELTAFMRWLDRGVQFDYPSIRGPEAGWGRFYSANASIKRSLFERVGGFDAERLAYLYEDLDFAYRASREGFRLLYRPDAVSDHLGATDLDAWRRRAPALARAELAFVRKHPELPPYFHDKFRGASEWPPVRGRGRHLIRWLPPRFPVLGPAAWRSADLYYRQALAPAFLAAWCSAAAE